MRIRFWGVRGTVPTPGPATVRYGGNTPCLDVLTSNQQTIILDAGTGIRLLGETLGLEYPGGVEATILLSHTHWDHIQGLPFFKPLRSRRNRIKLIGPKRMNRRLEDIVSRQFQEPYMPFAYRSLAATLDVLEVDAGEMITLDEQLIVTAVELNHPGGCLGFRIQDQETVLAYLTDTGWYKGPFGANIMELVRDADLLIHDSFFTNPELAESFVDWGHSSWQEAVRLAEDANVKALGLFHYAPDATDDALDLMLEEARNVFSGTFLTREGMVIHLPNVVEVPE